MPDPTYELGQIVHHRRYGYRGVIFGVDPECRADMDWYLSNKTQPDREQPWYHVMVDGGDHTTYVAQSNLEPDIDRSPISHPLIERFFAAFHGGHYHVEPLN